MTQASAPQHTTCLLLLLLGLMALLEHGLEWAGYARVGAQ